MKGFPFSCYPEGLAEISQHANPAWTVRGLKKKLAPHREYIEAMREWPNSRKELIDLCGSVSRQCLAQLSFEDIAKIYWSRIVQMQRSVHEMFEQRAECELVRKLRNCNVALGRIWRQRGEGLEYDGACIPRHPSVRFRSPRFYGAARLLDVLQPKGICKMLPCVP